MRKRHVCPKCRHNRILIIEAVPDKGELSTELHHMHVAVAFAGEGWLGDKLKPAGELSACVCRKCGYTELYTRDAPLIPVDGKYVREVVGPEQADEGPYR